MRKLVSKELLTLLPAAGLRSASKQSPIFFETTFRLLHPWFSSAARDKIKFAKLKNDDDLIALLDDMTIDWHMTRDFELAKQRVADGLALDYISLKIKRSTVLAEMARSVFQDRIRILGLSDRERGRERLKALNFDWEAAQHRRRDFDPLTVWQSFKFNDWMIKPQWSRTDAVSLLLRLNPALFDEDHLDLVTPFSVLGVKAKTLLRLVDAAASAQDLKFPVTPMHFRRWAQDNRIHVPREMLPRQPKQAKQPRPVSVSTEAAIADAIQLVAAELDCVFVREKTWEIVAQAFNENDLSKYRFDRKIWSNLPPTLKRPNGRRKSEQAETWPLITSMLRRRLEKIAEGRNPQA